MSGGNGVSVHYGGFWLVVLDCVMTLAHRDTKLGGGESFNWGVGAIAHHVICILKLFRYENALGWQLFAIHSEGILLLLRSPHKDLTYPFALVCSAQKNRLWFFYTR